MICSLAFKFIYMETKVCGKCNEEKMVTEYYKVNSKSDRLRSICKTCHSIQSKTNNEKNSVRRKELSKIWCQKNRDKRRKQQIIRYKNNPEKHRLSYKKWKEKNPNYRKDYKEKNREFLKEKSKEYREKNKEKLRALSKEHYIRNKENRLKQIKEYRKKTDYIKTRKKNNPTFRLKSNIRNLIRMAIIYNGHRKNSKSVEILGCSYEYFRKYIESQWESWMNWDNYGKYNGKESYGWDLDHKLPISSASTEEEILKLSHYTNFQPLCSYKNRNLKRDLMDWFD